MYLSINNQGKKKINTNFKYADTFNILSNIIFAEHILLLSFRYYYILPHKFNLQDAILETSIIKRTCTLTSGK